MKWDWRDLLGLLMIVAIVIALMLVAGCDAVHVVRRDTIDVHIAPECLTECVIDAPLITEDPQTVIDALVTDRSRLKQCDLKRKLCASALERGVDSGAIK